jgi:hypothetical protein
MILYALLIFFMLAIPVFQPLTQAVADPALTWQERARAGTTTCSRYTTTTGHGHWERPSSSSSNVCMPSEPCAISPRPSSA